MLRGGTDRTDSLNVDAQPTLQSYAGERPWLNGATVITNWAADTTAVPGRTVWAMGTSGFDPDGAGPVGAKNLECPQYRDFHYSTSPGTRSPTTAKRCPSPTAPARRPRSSRSGCTAS